MKSFPCAFRVTRGNNGRMQVNKPLLLEKLVHGISQAVTHPEYGAKRISTETQVRYLT